MNAKKLLRDFAYAAFAQVVALLLSFTLSFFVPKFLSLDEFGYWQLFIFYASYAGLFTLGLNDGVYLLNGGVVRDKICKSSVCAQFFVAVWMQLLFFVGLVAIASTLFQSERQIVIILFAAYMVLYNLSGYLGYLFQAMGETRLFSIASIISKGVFFVPLVALLLLRVDSFVPYACFYACSQAFALLFCCYKAKDILAPSLFSAKQAIKESWESACVGIKLMLANVSSMLILGSMRFLIDGSWGVAVFGEISFSLSLVSLFIVFITQLSMVLFPALRQLDRERLSNTFGVLRQSLGLMLPIAYILVFPVSALVSWWLPQYANSMIYFVMLLPICIFDGKMNLLGATFMKVLRQERYILILNVCCVVVSVCLTCFGIFIVGSVYFVVLASVAVIATRSVIAEIHISKHLGAPRASVNLLVGELVLTIVYLAASTTLPILAAFAISCIAYLTHLFVFRNEARSIMSIARKHGKKD